MTKLETTLLNLAHQHLAELFCLYELGSDGKARPEDQEGFVQINAALDALLELSHLPDSGMSEEAVTRMLEVKARRATLVAGLKVMATAVANWAKSEQLVRKAYLFGSRVRGTNSPDSDLDVAVEIATLENDSCPLTTWTAEAQRLKASIVGVVPVIIDLDWYGGEEETPRIHHALQQSSMLVYDIEAD
ncbi:nucleotidyltransferase family protein [Pseudomonas mosselii]|uniref:nucleotidyltransferase family protein n=1 Tax=Pseudomonas mosselii TaxID=78327 RepID=UPI0021D7DFE4|nr:nucleotidyltransferase domain-containing protein [Pseudomonas mosselii]MCU9527494.1 nucleotidyltransferase domain-containing protein [Pseudomonas mosselii]MCU9534807.1 nucleotidyltransferase domain-containing protein [Pseudomonas mosselii]MCU9542741.1 nucleotidyltransferase domain-containing protein [Pseudomonas mosselii]MCU9546647.1 nucleotidyltransferase domain-containing protein [Pseudomonas mosselii]